MIITLYKKLDPSKTVNYRGIALLAVLGKCFICILIRRLVWLIDFMLLEKQFGFRPYRGRIQSLSILQRLTESSGSSKVGMYAIYIDLEQCFDRIPRRKLWRALRKRGIPKQFVKLFRDLYSNTRCRVRSENQLGPWFKVACGVRQGSVGGPFLASVYMDHMMRKVLHGHPNLGVAFQHRFDGRWVDAEEMDHETRIACWIYADDCVLFASSEADLQTLYTSLAKVFKAEGMLISLSKTEASV